ncbi:MAG: hypothetical protein JO272_04910 [Pseudonocardiales bacterium]|nr:hypothetical protein [Pseudonocardiales bacterium]
MNTVHTETSIKISEEAHIPGVKLFVPFCYTQGCQWIGSIHFDKLSAYREGQGHLDEVKPHRGPGAGSGSSPSVQGTQR